VTIYIYIYYIIIYYYKYYIIDIFSMMLPLGESQRRRLPPCACEVDCCEFSTTIRSEQRHLLLLLAAGL
jgi:hypothetical protein